MSFRKIATTDEFQQVMEKENRFFLLKNSTTCPISQEAYKETDSFSKQQTDVPVYFLNVQESRALSNEIAESFSIKHESPQALLFENKNVVWHDSHWKITDKNLMNAWNK